MKKTTAHIPFAFRFDPTHKGAPYTIDGEHWMNAGQFKQVARIATACDRMTRPDNVRYDADSDIPEFHESIKSSKATLVNMVLGDDLETSLEFYMSHTASLVHSWVFLLDDEVVTYLMDATEFIEFTRTFGWFDKDRKVVRYKADSTKMVKWFEARV